MSKTPVTLDTVASQTWQVRMKGKLYGPFSTDKIREFLKQGRIKPTTEISTGNGSFTPIAACPVFASAIDVVDTSDMPVVLNKKAPVAKGEPGNFVIFTKMTGVARSQFLDALNNSGKWAEAIDGIYLLRSRHTSVDLQSRLTKGLNPTDQLMIVDASRNRLSWHNMGVELDAHLRATWDTDL